MNYVGTNWEKGNDLRPLIHHLQHPEKYIEEPPDIAPDRNTAAGKYEKWKNKVNLHDKRMDNLAENCTIWLLDSVHQIWRLKFVETRSL